MRWERLFDDLEAQLDAHTRLLANVGATQVGLRLRERVVAGRLVDVGPDWALVETAPGRPVLVALTAVRAVSGLRPGARTPSVVARRFALGAALRAVSRDRAVVEVTDVDGQPATGTIDVVGSDHLELAEHASDETRRSANGTGRLLVPFWSLGTVRRL